jgi:hypothetical protein
MSVHSDYVRKDRQPTKGAISSRVKVTEPYYSSMSSDRRQRFVDSPVTGTPSVAQLYMKWMTGFFA